MNHLLRPLVWPSFLASSGVGSCDVPFRYALEPIPRYRGTVARWHAHLHGLATVIHETSGLEVFYGIAHTLACQSEYFRSVLYLPGGQFV